MSRSLNLGSISTRLRRIAELAREDRERSFMTLAHYIDEHWLWEAYSADSQGRGGRHRRPDSEGVRAESAGQPSVAARSLQVGPLPGAAGQAGSHSEGRRVGDAPDRDTHLRGQGAAACGGDGARGRLRGGLLGLLVRFPARSFGARCARRSAPQSCWSSGAGGCSRSTSRASLTSSSHEHLRAFLDHRVRDGVIRRAIGKWLQAGVMEEGRVHHSEAGTPQGGVISPLLANVYLHEVVDRWFAEDVQPRLRGRARLVRYADDLVIVFADEHDARRVEKVLAKRFARFGLRLHPEKARLVQFRRPPWGSDGAGPEGPGTFVFLGFTHLWAKGRQRGSWVVRRKTAPSRLTRSLKRAREWCGRARHWPLAEQHAYSGEGDHVFRRRRPPVGAKRRAGARG